MIDARAKATELLNIFGDALNRPRLGDLVLAMFDAEGLIVSLAPATHEGSIEANMVVTAPMVPGADSVLETEADAEERHYLGNAASALESPYRKPKDKRVQKLLRDAEAARAAEAPAPARQIFTDPRLDPKYRAPKK